MTSDSVAEIDLLLKEQVAAVAASSASQYAASYDQKGAVISPYVPAIVGHAAIESWTAEFFNSWEITIDSLFIEDRRIGDSVGFSRYRMLGRGQPKKGGPEIQLDHTYVDTYVKDETGKWKVAVHMVNTNTKGVSVWD